MILQPHYIGYTESDSRGSGIAKEYPDWIEKIESGNLAFVREWLQKNIHAHGRMYDADTLVKKVIGKPLAESTYCFYLKKKYSP